MYEFPLIETSKDTDLADLMDTDLFKTMFNETQIVIHSVSNKIKHMLTHQHLFAKFYVVEVLKSDAFLTKSYLKINETDISLYPISRLIHRYLEEK
jgi:A/G-specific adenine glycosylase